jgi:hypothetical protein
MVEMERERSLQWGWWLWYRWWEERKSNKEDGIVYNQIDLG